MVQSVKMENRGLPDSDLKGLKGWELRRKERWRVHKTPQGHWHAYSVPI